MAQATPSITQKEFDAIEAKLRRELRRWYDDESETPPPTSSASMPSTEGAWDGMPAIDSKAVVKASTIFKKYLGVDLDPKLIRKGGYSSFDDFVDDLLPKLRAACLKGAAKGAARSTSRAQEEARNE